MLGGFRRKVSRSRELSIIAEVDKARPDYSQSVVGARKIWRGEISLCPAKHNCTHLFYAPLLMKQR